ncbi:MAG TPA: hypothetical protein VNM14_14285 [Planctomycetota bacterium]|jgi:hypothetical protein|nr:hypothetical protein [Planctomycetota bacterium]
MEESGNRPDRWPWTLWALTTFTLFSLAWMTSVSIRATTALYYQMEIQFLPIGTEVVLKYKESLWILALAAAASGIPFARRGDAEKTQRWALVLLLLTLTVGAGIASALLTPMIPVGLLSNK